MRILENIVPVCRNSEGWRVQLSHSGVSVCMAWNEKGNIIWGQSRGRGTSFPGGVFNSRNTYLICTREKSNLCIWNATFLTFVTAIYLNLSLQLLLASSLLQVFILLISYWNCLNLHVVHEDNFWWLGSVVKQWEIMSHLMFLNVLRVSGRAPTYFSRMLPNFLLCVKWLRDIKYTNRRRLVFLTWKEWRILQTSNKQ